MKNKKQKTQNPKNKQKYSSRRKLSSGGRQRSVACLQRLRAQIDKVDRQIQHVLQARLRLVDEVFALKDENHLPLCDQRRVHEVLHSAAAHCSAEDFEQFFRPVFQEILKRSLLHQKQKKITPRSR